MSSKKTRTSNGYHNLPEALEQEAISGPNETTEFENEEETIQRSRPNVKRKSRLSQQKDDESLSAQFSSWLFDHQIGISVNLLVLLMLTHIFYPRARFQTRKFLYLSYYNPKSEKYGVGWDDAYLILNWIILLTGLRVVIMDYLLSPLAQLGGLKGKGKVRFAEQAWLIVYAGTSSAVGTYIMYHSDYWLNIPMVWAGWPNREMTSLFKWYYLVQFAFWIQQIMVVHIEARRKDHWQMVSHHIVTCALMFWSYGYHHYKVGNVILVIMDSCDLSLSTAKVLKYLKYRKACDIAFGIFMIHWFLLRHCAYLAICWSIIKDVPTVMPNGCYSGSNDNLKGPFPPPNSWSVLLQPFHDPEGTVCQTDGISTIFLTMLIMLQILLAIWFGMIINVAYKVITGKGAEDVRSDDEVDDEELELDDESTETQDEKIQEYKPPIELEVGVEDLRFTTTTDRKPLFKKSSSTTSGVSLPHDRKELLGRIGCDKQA